MKMFLFVSENGKFQETKKDKDNTITIVSPSKKMAEKVIKVIDTPSKIKGKRKKVFVLGKKYKWQVDVTASRFVLEFHGQIEKVDHELVINVFDKKTKLPIDGFKVIVSPKDNEYYVNFDK